jgi:hypothetical protein
LSKIDASINLISVKAPIEGLGEYPMSKQKQTWKSVKLPSQVVEQIKRVIPWLGFPSVAEYVRYTVRERLRRDMLYVDDIEEKIERAKEDEL